jgi:hypothetical protein
MPTIQQIEAYPPHFKNILAVLAQKNEWKSPFMPFNEALHWRQRWYKYRKDFSTVAEEFERLWKLQPRKEAGAELKQRYEEALAYRKQWIAYGWLLPLSTWLRRLSIQFYDDEGNKVSHNMSPLLRPDEVSIRYFDTFQAASGVEEALAKELAIMEISKVTGSPARETTGNIATPFTKPGAPEDNGDDLFKRLYQLDKPNEVQQIDPEEEKKWNEQYKARTLKRELEEQLGKAPEESDPKK